MTKKTIEIDVTGDFLFPFIDSLDVQGKAVTITLTDAVVAGLSASIGAVATRQRDGQGEVRLKLTAAAAIVAPVAAAVAPVPPVSAPSFAMADTLTFGLGEAVTVPVTTDAAAQLTVVGDLPPGLALVDGAIIGTTTEVGTFAFSLTAQNASGQTTQAITVIVAQE